MHKIHVPIRCAIATLFLLSTILSFLFCSGVPNVIAAEAEVHSRKEYSKGITTVSPAAPATATRTKTLFDFGTPVQGPVREWTILVYMDGDNDLERFAISDINEMEAGITENVEIVVLIDRAEGYDQSEGDWTDARIYRIRKDNDDKKINSDFLAKPGELNLGDSQVLESFLSSAIKTFPAKHYALVMWNHGGGWVAHANDYDAPGTKNGQDYLTLPGLSSAIRNAMKLTGLKRFDLIGFDMCLMAQLETSTELEGLADVLVASQAVEPGDGWPYSEILPEFGKGTRGTRRIASSIVQKYGEFYQRQDTAVSTLSAMDITKVDRTLKALDKVVAKLDTKLGSAWPTISRALFFSEAYAARSEVQRSKHALASVDLLDALKRMRFNIKDFPAHDEYDALVTAMDGFIIASHTSQVRRLSNGVAIYAPVTAANFNESYRQTRFARISSWTAFLDKLHKLQAKDQRTPIVRDLQLVDAGNNKIVPIKRAVPLNTHGVQYTVEGSNILWIVSMKGKRSEDGKELLVYTKGIVLDADWSTRKKNTAADKLDLVIPEYVDGVNQSILLYPGTRYAVSNGKEAYYATVDETDLQGRFNSVPIIYNHPSTGKLGGTVYFDQKWWVGNTVVLEVPQKDGTMMYRQVKPEPDAEITTLFELLADNGQISYAQGGTMKWGDGLELLLAMDKAGTYEISLVAETIGGRSNTVFYKFTVEDDPNLKAFLDEGSDFTAKDLIGTWDYINPRKFRNNNLIEALGLVQNFSKHPKLEKLLISEWTSPKRPDFKKIQLAFLDKRMLPHLRLIALPEKGKPLDPLDVNFSVYITTMFKTRQGQLVLIQKSALGGAITMLAKRQESKAGQQYQGNTTGQPPGTSSTGYSGQQSQTPQPQPVPQALQPQAVPQVSLAGIWQSQTGDVLKLAGQQYQLFRFNQMTDAGVFQVQGNQLAMQSAYTQQTIVYRYQVSANNLLLQNALGQAFQFFRSSSQQGGMQGDPGQQGGMQGYPGQQGGTRPTGQEYLLRGKFCSRSGTSGSSYEVSSSNWAIFDGQERFTFGTSSHYSGDAGTYYDRGGNPENQGSYRVQGSTIHLIYSDGSSDTAAAVTWAADGTITALKYEGQYYKGTLCE